MVVEEGRDVSRSVTAHHRALMSGEGLDHGVGTGDVEDHDRAPLLDEEIVEVKERQKPPPEEVTDLGPDCWRPFDPENTQNNEVWVKWKRVESFFASAPRSRRRPGTG